MQAWGDIQELVLPVRQGLAFLRASLSASWSADYEVWRNSFLRNRLRLTLRISLGAVFTVILLILAMAALNQKFAWSQLLIGLAVELCLLTCLALLNTPLSYRYPGLLFLGFSWSIILVPQIGSSLLGNTELNVFNGTFAFLTQATLMPVRWPLHLLSQLSAPIFYLGVNLAFNLNVDQQIYLNLPLNLYLFWFCFICDLSVFLYERLQRSEFQGRREIEVAYQKLESERKRTERLLLNILPQPIAERLKQEEHTIADQFPEATVLFADVVGFTQLASEISAAELVVLLNRLFSMFDQLAEHHGVEKIKTIGDAYMVVAGLPTPRSDHAQAIANLAIDMQHAVAHFNVEMNQSLSIRIGINTGPVVAGVIGLKRFIYDLWGDTVNIASRMESQGIAGVIQVSEATYECLKQHYLFQKRGVIQVKGKGEMTTYLLMGKSSLSLISRLPS
ncbi:adenylate/guanylate cyclase domain-containing protein [Microcoleus sp. FACHB-53]|nr:adenylate/guanylate cyclase domain-containing protein [Microcoleus sp. FACHB-53]